LTVSPTGYFGQATRAAVIRFQSENGINSTGFVGQLTRAQLKVKSCEPLMPIPTTPLDPVSSISPASPATNVQITSLSVFTVAPGFSTSPAIVENGNKFTATFKALDITFDAQHYVKLAYKNSSKVCILTASFLPVAGKTYNLIRSSESSCLLGGLVGPIADIDRIEIIKQ
jgi:peptidoglycan hydrolase-like protein with peptidoglycan-binding domain